MRIEKFFFFFLMSPNQPVLLECFHQLVIYTTVVVQCLEREKEGLKLEGGRKVLECFVIKKLASFFIVAFKRSRHAWEKHSGHKKNILGTLYLTSFPSQNHLHLPFYLTKIKTLYWI